MQKKDLIYVVLAVIIIVVAGFLMLTQLSPKSSSKTSGTTVDVIGVISPSFDNKTASLLVDPAKTRDFTATIDLTTGIGNTAPFGH